MNTRKKEPKAKSKPKEKRAVAFTLEIGPGHAVTVAGTFNDWDAAAFVLQDDGNGVYHGTLLLPPGKYEYKYVVDEEWMMDHHNPEFVLNDLGTLNSVLIVE